LTVGGGIPELVAFQNHFANEYRIVVYEGFDCNRILFNGQTDSERRINLLYDDVTRHYHVIGSLTGFMAKQYVCTACNKSYNHATMHTCDQTRPGCMKCPPCIETGNRIPCFECNRHFRSQTCFNNHKTKQKKAKKTLCEKKKCCVTCGVLITGKRQHICTERYCSVCSQYRKLGHLCYMSPLKDELPSTSKVLFVFYDFETTQDTVYSETATEHVPNLLCLQQFCSQCENIADIDVDCPQCLKRKHSFWEDPVGNLLTYLCEPRPWCKKLITIAHNAKAFDF
jgi:hypothetical protein